MIMVLRNDLAISQVVMKLEWYTVSQKVDEDNYPFLCGFLLHSSNFAHAFTMRFVSVVPSRLMTPCVQMPQ